jgi:hypothetical protein
MASGSRAAAIRDVSPTIGVQRRLLYANVRLAYKTLHNGPAERYNSYGRVRFTVRKATQVNGRRQQFAANGSQPAPYGRMSCGRAARRAKERQ